MERFRLLEPSVPAFEVNTGIFERPHQVPQRGSLTFDKGRRVGSGGEIACRPPAPTGLKNSVTEGVTY